MVNDRLVASELAPELILHLGRYPADEGWGVQLAAGANEGECVLSPSEPDFQSAGPWAADWLLLRGDALAAHNLRRLIAATMRLVNPTEQHSFERQRNTRTCFVDVHTTIMAIEAPAREHRTTRSDERAVSRSSSP